MKLHNTSNVSLEIWCKNHNSQCWRISF